MSMYKQTKPITYTAEHARDARAKLSTEFEKELVTTEAERFTGPKGFGVESSLELIGKLAMFILASEYEHNPDLRKNRTWRTLASERMKKKNKPS